jgi:hypothetical protein
MNAKLLAESKAENTAIEENAVGLTKLAING